MDAGYVPLGLDALVGLAHLLATEGERERAMEILAFVVQHPGLRQIARDKAQELLSELETELPPKTLATATARGEARELEDVAAEILGER